MSKAFNVILEAILAEASFEDVSPTLLTNWNCTNPGERSLIKVLLKKYAGGGGAGGGDVSGPSGVVTDNAIARWNGTDGENIQNSTVIVDDNGNVTFPSAAALRTGTTAANSFLLRAYDVDGVAYKTFVTLTAGNTPSMDIAVPAGGTGTMNGVTIGGVTPAAGTFSSVSVLGVFEVTSDTTTLARFELPNGFSLRIKGNGVDTEDFDVEIPNGPGGVWTVKLEAPVASSDPGFEGAWAEDGDYVYVYSAIAGAWRRTSLADW